MSSSCILDMSEEVGAIARARAAVAASRLLRSAGNDGKRGDQDIRRRAAQLCPFVCSNHRDYPAFGL